MSTAGKVRTQASSAHADAHGGDAAPRLGFSLLGRVEGGRGWEGGRVGSPCLCACLTPALTSLVTPSHTRTVTHTGSAASRRSVDNAHEHMPITTQAPLPLLHPLHLRPLLNPPSTHRRRPGTRRRRPKTRWRRPGTRRCVDI